jgi:two-component system nitrate/nitrite response regulator NarL
MLRVLVVSDVRLFQEGVSSVLALQSDVEVVGSADILRARDRITELHPDVVLFDATRRGSTEQIKHLVASAPNTKVVAFGVTETNSEILALAAAGTAAYVRDGAEARDVVGILDRVMRDELLCSPRTAASLYHQVAVLSQGQSALTQRLKASDGAFNARAKDVASARPGPQAEENGHIGANLLSRREVQIAHLIERGLSNKQIARQLGIAATTAKNHVHNIFEKLKVHRRSDAAAQIRVNLQSLAWPLVTESETPAAAPEFR